MNDMGLAVKTTSAAFDRRHRLVDISDVVIEDRSGLELCALRNTEVEPGHTTLEESHRLTRHLEKEIEAENIAIPGHRTLQIGDTDVDLANRGNGRRFHK